MRGRLESSLRPPITHIPFSPKAIWCSGLQETLPGRRNVPPGVLTKNPYLGLSFPVCEQKAFDDFPENRIQDRDLPGMWTGQWDKAL